MSEDVTPLVSMVYFGKLAGTSLVEHITNKLYYVFSDLPTDIAVTVQPLLLLKVCSTIEKHYKNDH